VKIRGGPAAVIGEKDLPRDKHSVTFEDHLEGKAADPFVDPKARRPAEEAAKGF
jgi:hypothetical protein